MFTLNLRFGKCHQHSNNVFSACHVSKYRSLKLISTSILKDPTSNVPFSLT